MCGVKLIDRRNTRELMDMLVVKESLNRMVKASSMRQNGYVFMKEDESVLVLKI